MRTGGQQVPSDFENDRLFPARGGEVIQKLVEAVPGREVVEKVLFSASIAGPDLDSPESFSKSVTVLAASVANGAPNSPR